MIRRFCLYSIFKNLRFFEHFFVLYLLAPPAQGGAGLSFLSIGSLIGYQKLLTMLLEIPTGFVADQGGRRRSLVLTFTCYSLAFPLYGLSSTLDDSARFVGLVVAQTLFGIAEAFRTGTHKAIILDWAQQTPDSGGAVRVLGVTRFWSKLTAGVSALAAGVLVWSTASFSWLFWLSTVPALLGIALIVSYPRWLDGEYGRDPKPTPSIFQRQRWTTLWAAPGIGLLFLQSVLFESQIKLGQHYLQPFLERGLGVREITVVGGIGAVLIGVYFLIQDGLGGVASWFSGRFAGEIGSEARGLLFIHGAGALVSVGVAWSLFGNALVAGSVGFIVLTMLQNLRRPIFVSAFDRVMDRPQRAATLSIESQARSLVYAVLAPVTGWLADRFGLPWVFVVLAAVAVLTVVVGRGRIRRNPVSSGGSP